MYEHGFKGRKPVEEGKGYTVTMVDVGSQWDGVARIGGLNIFVPDTERGDKVKFRVVRVTKNSAIERVVP
jgi:23S rRNA (uridine2552-2'-O)-methyltransferase